MPRKVKLLTFACLVTLTFTVGIIGTSFHFHYLMFREVESVHATVFKPIPEDHAAVYYRYTADSLTFEGVGSSVDYMPGDRVKIVYAINDPGDSELKENVPTARGMIAFTLIGSLFTSSFGTALLSIGMSTRQKSTQFTHHRK